MKAPLDMTARELELELVSVARSGAGWAALATTTDGRAFATGRHNTLTGALRALVKLIRQEMS